MVIEEEEVQTRSRSVSSVKSPVAVLFDVDGTLCNSCELAFANTNIILQKEGLPPVDMETYHFATKFSTPKRFAWHVTGNAEDDSGVGQRLADEFDSTYIDLVSKDTAGLFDGLEVALRNVKSRFPTLKYGAMTNGAGAFARAVLKKNGIADMFEFGFGADELPAPKPSPAGLINCLNFINLPATSCIYIGDSPTVSSHFLTVFVFTVHTHSFPYSTN